ARAEGNVRLDDVDLYGSDVDVVAVRRAIGMVFQKPNPFPTMSIFDNVAAGLRFTGVARDETSDRVRTALQRAGLWEEVGGPRGRPHHVHAGRGAGGGRSDGKALHESRGRAHRALRDGEVRMMLEPRVQYREELERLEARALEGIDMVVRTLDRTLEAVET